MINKIFDKADTRYDVQTLKEQLDRVKKLDFSQNKQIYNSSFKSCLSDAFESFQNKHNLNLENDTVDYFVTNVIKVQDDFNMASDLDEEFKDVVIFNLIKHCKNLEEINLNNLNLGDYFLKSFSLYIAEEKKDLTQNFNLLRVFKIRNNSRFTSVGLKYLYCAAVKRYDIEIIDVSFKGQVSSGITYFVNNGLNGMVDYYILDSWNKLKLIYEKKRGRLLKFFCNCKTLQIFSLYLVNSAFIIFHLVEKMIYYAPYVLLTLVKPLNMQKYLKKCLDSCFRCFDQSWSRKKESSTINNSVINNGESPTRVRPPNSAIVKVNKCNFSCNCKFSQFFAEQEKDYDIELFYHGLRQRYTKCINNLPGYVGKDYEMIKDQSLFYFDESLIVLNDILGQNSHSKSNKVFSTAEQELSFFHNHVTKKFHLISKLRWIFLVNFFCFFTASLFYLIFIKIKWNQNATLFWQIPYFGYAVLSFIVELYLCWEVIAIIDNPNLISRTSPMLIGSLLSSQAAKYDLFTDATFVLSLYNIDPVTKQATYNNIFIASLAVLSLKLFIHIFQFLDFLWKYFLKRRNHQSYSSKFINSYSKTCFLFEFQGLGRLLDKFSTASAQKYRYWWLPKGLYNVYIPMVITATFTRLFIEDVPQLIIQTINLLRRTDKNIDDFTILASLLSTIFTMFLTLHTAWNVRPSYFSREIFKLYHDNLLLPEGEEEDDESVSQSSSHLEGSYLEHSEHRSVQSYDDKNSNPDQKEEPQTDEKDEEREELFGGGRQKKIFFKEDL